MRWTLACSRWSSPAGPTEPSRTGLIHCSNILESLLKEHQEKNGTELGFHLTSTQCQSLREEAVQYYHRYLSLFVLEDFDGVVRDTARNLRVLDLCGKYAVEEQDRLVLEQYRPYIVMMNVKATATLLTDKKEYKEALVIVDEGIEMIREFFARFEQEEAFGHSNEVRVLRRFARDIRRKLPVDPIQKLQGQLEHAVKQERYEDAARIRDEIRRKEESKVEGPG